ncbi:MAG TPA: hypothetical protein PLY73_14190, partial [Candidatus Ozemobacteraceae bacterium]|nr:hypothetical protein [Candidatus Ozemobacteraceae bacterium]
NSHLPMVPHFALRQAQGERLVFILQVSIMYNRRYNMKSALYMVLFAIMLGALFPAVLHAYCDTFAGPALIEAREALEKGDVTPLLNWVKRGPRRSPAAAVPARVTGNDEGVEHRHEAPISE